MKIQAMEPLGPFEEKITIDVPLILKIREIIFSAGKSLYGPFQGIL
jgi:hypothetical protein